MIGNLSWKALSGISQAINKSVTFTITTLPGVVLVTGDLALETLFVLLVALAQGVLFFVQLRLMRVSLADTKTAAVAATLGAKSSRQSADTAKIIDDCKRASAYVHFAGLRYISHPDLADGRIFWQLRPHWRNSGNTPRAAFMCTSAMSFGTKYYPTITLLRRRFSPTNSREHSRSNPVDSLDLVLIIFGALILLTLRRD